MTYREAELTLFRQLQAFYSERESKQLSSWAMENITDKNRVDRLLLKDEELDDKMLHHWHSVLNRMQQHEPIQYVLGEAPFMDMMLHVNQYTLIPRPETEELVSWILDDHNEKKLDVLDVGTGSGCIALALKKKQPTWNITAADLSTEALAIAAKNSNQLNLSVEWKLLDMLQSNHPGWGDKYQVIVSNPPYIPVKDKVFLSKHVSKYEPSSALFVPDDEPLLFYKALLANSPAHLTNGGHLYMEINDQLGAATVNLFLVAGWEVELRKDLQGNDRMIKATPPKLTGE
ncbi:MAG: peptide chain release factor N(5)-glutamine methyltransferase [Chitinophagia bacterium]|nr:peptide chain release factor N(5)-glutamine methyltransferase [Chitinophagia bacterium]